MALKQTHLELPGETQLKEGRTVLAVISFVSAFWLGGAVALILLLHQLDLNAWVGIGSCLLLSLLSLFGLYVELQIQRKTYQERQQAFERMIGE